MGTPAENKALVQRFIDALNTGDVAGAAACFDAERYYSHAHGADLAGTWEKMKAAGRSGSFTETGSEPIVLLADGDRVVRHSTFVATHSAPYLGVDATGRRINFDFIEIWRIDNDKIVEHWGGLHETNRLYAQLTEDEA